MTKLTTAASKQAWEAIENERRRDRLIRRVSVVSWTITFLLVCVLGVVVCMQVIQLARGAAVGAVPWISVLGAAMPLIIVLGTLSVLVATLSTIGIFLRLRTASLAEIQLRLAAIEDMLGADVDAGQSGGR